MSWLVSAELLSQGIAVRGGIAVGPTVHQDGFLYGKGMIDAYDIESKVAFYPRIVLGQQVIDMLDISSSETSIISKDLDGMYYVDPFKYDAVSCNSNWLDDPHVIRSQFLTDVGNVIVESLENSKNEHQKQKWMWLANKHKIAREDYERNEMTNMEKQIKGIY